MQCLLWTTRGRWCTADRKPQATSVVRTSLSKALFYDWFEIRYLPLTIGHEVLKGCEKWRREGSVSHPTCFFSFTVSLSPNRSVPRSLLHRVRTGANGLEMWLKIRTAGVRFRWQSVDGLTPFRKQAGDGRGEAGHLCHAGGFDCVVMRDYYGVRGGR